MDARKVLDEEVARLREVAASDGYSLDHLSDQQLDDVAIAAVGCVVAQFVDQAIVNALMAQWIRKNGVRHGN